MLWRPWRSCGPRAAAGGELPSDWGRAFLADGAASSTSAAAAAAATASPSSAARRNCGRDTVVRGGPASARPRFRRANWRGAGCLATGCGWGAPKGEGCAPLPFPFLANLSHFCCLWQFLQTFRSFSRLLKCQAGFENSRQSLPFWAICNCFFVGNRPLLLPFSGICNHFIEAFATFGHFCAILIERNWSTNKNWSTKSFLCLWNQHRD